MLQMFQEKGPEPEKSPTKSCESGGMPRFGFSGNKIHFVSLGCPRNLVDSEVMLGILLKAGYEVSPDLPDADFLVINTCGFLEASRNESSETIESVLATRKKTAKLVVTGCMVQTHHDELQK